MAEPTEEETRAQRRLAARLGELGFVLPGSLVRRHTRCGNRRCHCYSEPPDLHGPYLQWTRTEQNKIVSRIWNDDQLSRYEGWLDNARPARETFSELDQKALAIAIVERDNPKDLVGPSAGPADHTLVLRAEAIARLAVEQRGQRCDSLRSKPAALWAGVLVARSSLPATTTPPSA